MTITVVAVGRIKGPLVHAIGEFESRARHYWRLEVVEVASGARGSQDPAKVLAAEAERLLAHVAPRTEVVALTREGEPMSSRALERFLSGLAVRSSAGASFLIGGAHGLGSPVLERAHRKLSLSEMTLPHEVARLILAEQLYRAGTITRGEPYHKGP